MPLAAGTRLGPYEVLGLIGAGGMGEVYNARDTRLDRTVALKILPPQFSADPERRARFELEAKTIAGLTHPHICTLHDVGTDSGSTYLVMELLTGETLAARLRKGPLSVEQALIVATQIADALAAAHRQDVIHRDLKPGNVMLTNTGAKLLDFGLAKVLAPSGIDPLTSPTTAPATQQGVILGTAAYMSPEQARGTPADARADNWAFGLVLYEMLTGERAFAGNTATDLLAAVMRSEPDWNKLPPATPSGVRRLLRACLQKDRAQRLQAIGDARLFLDEPVEFRAPAPAAGRRSTLPWMIATLVLAAVLGVVFGVRLRETPVPNDVVTFTVPPPPDAFISEAVISPDGTRLLLRASDRTGKGNLWMRRLDSLELQPLAGTEDAARPFWSPDSRSFGFYAGSRLFKFDVGRGSAQFLYQAGLTLGSAWLSDGSIIFARNLDGLFRLRPGSGEAQQLTTLDAGRKESRHYWPVMLPDNRHFLYLVTSTLPEARGIWVASLDAPSDRRRLLGDLAMPSFSAGRLFFVRGDTLMAQPFDAGRLVLGGEAVPVLDHVAHFTNTGYGSFSTAVNGTVAALRTPEPWRLTWYDRAGRSLGPFGAGGRYQSLSLSPDEKRVAVDGDSDVASGYRIYVIDHERDTTAQLTVGDATGNQPVWSPDGAQIAFVSNRDGVYNIYVKPSTGAGQEAIVLKNDRNKFLSDWSRDGRHLLYAERQPGTNLNDLRTLPMIGDRKPALYLRGAGDLRGGRFSPDGRWVAYFSDESSRWEVYVQSFPAGTDKVQISTTGGTRPVWRADGQELYYLTLTGTLMAVPVKPGPGFSAGLPKTLFQTWNRDSLVQYAAARDGRRFVLLAPEGDRASEPAIVILNRR